MATKDTINVAIRLLGMSDLEKAQSVISTIKDKRVTMTVRTQGIDVATRQQEQLAIRIEDMKGKIGALNVKIKEWGNKTKESTKALDTNRLNTFNLKLKAMEEQYIRNAQAIRTTVTAHAEEKIAAEAAARAQATLANRVKQAMTAFSQYAPTMQKVSRGIDKFLRGIARAPQMVARFADQFVHMGQVMATFAYRLTLITAPITYFIAQTGKGAIEFEHSMAMVATQLDLTGEELEQFMEETDKHIVDLSTRVSRSAVDISEAMRFLVSSLTISPEEARAALEPIAKAAVAGRATAEMVAESITPILDVYDLIVEDAEETTKNIQHVLDVIFAAVKRGRAEFSDMAVQLGDFVRVARLAGAGFEEAMAVYAEATRVTTAAQAATWVANVYRTLFTPKSVEALESMGIAIEEVVEGTGTWAAATKGLGEEQQKAHDAAKKALIGPEGVTGLLEKLAQQERDLAYFREQYALKETDARARSIREKLIDIGITRDRITHHKRIIADLNAEAKAVHRVWTGEMKRRESLVLITEFAKKVSGLRSEQEKLNKIYEVFPRMRAQLGALEFIENLAEITEWTEAWTEATGLTQEAFEIMSDTVKEKLKLIRQLFEAIGIDVFEAFEGDIKDFIDGFGELLRVIRKLDPDVKKQAYTWLGLLVAIGPATLIFSTLLMGLGGLVNVAAQLLSPIGILGLVLAFQSFGDVLSSAWGMIRDYTSEAGLKGLAVLVAELAVEFGLLEKSDAAKILESIGVSTGEIDSTNFDAFVESVREFGQGVSETWEKVKGYFQAFIKFIDDTAARENTTGKLIGHLADLVKWFTGLAGTDFDITKRGIEGVAEAIDTLASRLLVLWGIGKAAGLLAWIIRIGQGGAVGAKAAAAFLASSFGAAVVGAGAVGIGAYGLAETVAGRGAWPPYAEYVKQGKMTREQAIQALMEIHPGVMSREEAIDILGLPPREAAWRAPTYGAGLIGPPEPTYGAGLIGPPEPPAAAYIAGKPWWEQLWALTISPEITKFVTDVVELVTEAIGLEEIPHHLRLEYEWLMARGAELGGMPSAMSDLMVRLQDALLYDPSSLPQLLDEFRILMGQVEGPLEGLAGAAGGAGAALKTFSDALVAVGKAIMGGAWWPAFTEEHRGVTPLGKYEKHARPLQAALVDLLWSQDFYKTHGRPPTDPEWKYHWHETHLPFEAYPGGPIGALPSTVPFAAEANKMLEELGEEALPDLTTSVEDLELAFSSGQEALTEKTGELKDAVVGQTGATVDGTEAAWALVGALAAAAGRVGGEKKPPTEGEEEGEGEPRKGPVKPPAPVPYQFGGYAWADTLYRLAEHGIPEYVIDSPTLRQLEQQVGVLSQEKLLGMAGGRGAVYNFDMRGLSLPGVSDGYMFVEQMREIAQEADNLARVGYV